MNDTHVGWRNLSRIVNTPLYEFSHEVLNDILRSFVGELILGDIINEISSFFRGGQYVCVSVFLSYISNVVVERILFGHVITSILNVSNTMYAVVRLSYFVSLS